MNPAPPRVRLTERAHLLLTPHLGAGAIAIDATAGNGWDTAFLVSRVGPSGRVFSIDVQERAIEATRARIAGKPGCDCVTLICGSHADMERLVPAGVHRRVKAVMFNLGYLPSGDHELVTEPRSTLAALNAARELLAPDGAISILAYPGHPGGAQETQAVAHWVAQSGLRVVAHQSNATGPVLWHLVFATSSSQAGSKSGGRLGT